MFEQMKKAFTVGYPRQFWVLFFGTIIIRTGSSMIWPFTLTYVSDKLSVALAAAAFLLTVRSISSLVASFIAGPITDSAGRKTVMVIGITGYALTYVGMLFANSMTGFIIVMFCGGLIEPLFRVGVDAMLVDIIPEEIRIDAYSVNRMGQNVGIALGPMLGGLLISISYNIAFGAAITAMLIFLLLILFAVKETIAKRVPLSESMKPGELFDGYQRVFRDGRFMVSTVLITLAYIGFSQVWTLMQPFTGKVLGMSEAAFAFLPMTNAIMVIFLQLFFTIFSKRFNLLRTMVVGGLVYTISIFSFSVAQNFWMVWIGFIILTCGEMFIVPASTTYAANLAPDDMRGRYMSLYSLHWPLASGIGPLLGGFIGDNVGQRWIWVAAAIFPLIASLGYAVMDRREYRNQAQTEENFA